MRSGSWRGLEANADEAGIFEALLAFVDIRACVKHSFCRISQHEKFTISTLISAGLQPGKGIGEESFSSHCRFNRADGVGCKMSSVRTQWNSCHEDSDALGCMNVKCEEQITKLRQGLEHHDSEKQLETLIEICQYTKLTGISGLVLRFAGSRMDSQRLAAAKALDRSVQPNLRELPTLVAALDPEQDGEVVYWAATLIGRLGDQAEDAVDALCRCIKDSSFLAARERAVIALQKIGPAAQGAIPVLESVSDSATGRLKQLCQQTSRDLMFNHALGATRAA